jgi:hypothetical protein
MNRQITIERYFADKGHINESVLWHNIIVFVENKGTHSQKQSLFSIVSEKAHPGSIAIRQFIYQFLDLTRDKTSGKTNENLLFNLFASIDTAIL